MKQYNINKLKEISKEDRPIYSYSDLGKFLRAKTPWLDMRYKTVFPRQRLWHLINNTKDNPGCVICQNDIKWDDTLKTYKQRYRKYCCKKCQMNDPNIKKLKKETELKRYGKGRPSIVAKMKNTNNERYGTDFAIQTEHFKKKRNNTCMNKYGVDNPAKVKKFMDARKKTNLEKFGYEFPAQSPICMENAKQTYHKNYNVEHISHRTLLPETIIKLKNREWLKSEHHENMKTVSQIAKELEINISALCRYFHKYDITIKNFHLSTGEKEIITFLEKHNVIVESGNRKIISPQEIDIYLPEHNLAIEFNGNYWHSELAGRGRKYHLDKTNGCKEKDVQVIHILESEWVTKQDIIKSRLLNMLGKSNIIYGIKFIIIVVSTDSKQKFLKENHLQGSIGSSVNVGLIYENKLVAMMTFGKPRFSKQHEYELLRFVTQKNINVVGGASKLFQNFLRKYKPNSVVSYADLRYSTGNLYNKLGFNFSHNSTPNCQYFHKSNPFMLYSRLKFQKHKLDRILDTFDSNLSAWQNMINNGYNRIWDCGNSVWVWSNN